MHCAWLLKKLHVNSGEIEMGPVSRQVHKQLLRSRQKMSNDEQRQPEKKGRHAAIINPPQPIDLSQNRKDNFECFHKQWQNYSIVSRLHDGTEAYQVALLKYTEGEQCVKIIENAGTEH